VHELALGRLTIVTDRRELIEAADCSLIPGTPETDLCVTIKIETGDASGGEKPSELLLPSAEGPDPVRVTFTIDYDREGLIFSLWAPFDSLTRTQNIIMTEWLLRIGIITCWRPLNAMFFHASAVVKDGKSILFLGPSGSGKSTLVAHGLKSGWKAVGDDVVLFRQGEKGGRLLPVTTVAGLFDGIDRGFPMEPYYQGVGEDRKYQPLPHSFFSPGPMPSTVFFPRVTQRETSGFNRLERDALRVTNLVRSCLNLKLATREERQIVLSALVYLAKTLDFRVLDLGADLQRGQISLIEYLEAPTSY